MDFENLRGWKGVETGFHSWLGMRGLSEDLDRPESLLAPSGGSQLWEISFRRIMPLENGVKTVLAGQEVRDSRDSSVDLWLRLHTFTAKGTGSILGQETEIPQGTWSIQ